MKQVVKMYNEFEIEKGNNQAIIANRVFLTDLGIEFGRMAEDRVKMDENYNLVMNKFHTTHNVLYKKILAGNCKEVAIDSKCSFCIKFDGYKVIFSTK